MVGCSSPCLTPVFLHTALMRHRAALTSQRDIAESEPATPFRSLPPDLDSAMAMQKTWCLLAELVLTSLAPAFPEVCRDPLKEGGSGDRGLLRTYFLNSHC